MRVSLTNVRGFEGTHFVQIRPLTVLIGENSSGKTTLLASIFAALNRQFPTAENLFNRAPFDLGSFDTIATYRGGKYGRATNFTLGWEIRDAALSATFHNADGTPRLNAFTAKDGDNSIHGRTSAGEMLIDLATQDEPSDDPRGHRRNKSSHNYHFTVPAQTASSKTFRFDSLFGYLVESIQPLSREGKLTAELARLLTNVQRMMLGLRASLPHVTALSPLRTRPRRTYDELNDEFKPEGDHVPLILARLLAGKHKEHGPEIQTLLKFGAASGLFEKIDVKRLGKQPSDPFQVRIKMKGPDANLVDVGYGVSQALPIAMESIVAPNNELLLIQQPEVHLHPKAQAALGTFFAELAAGTTGKQFVIETHSDYLIDRIRMAVAEQTIRADRVQFLYLERHGLDIRIHELRLDNFGNITNAPPGYRSFFLQEELKLMHRLSE